MLEKLLGESEDWMWQNPDVSLSTLIEKVLEDALPMYAYFYLLEISVTIHMRIFSRILCCSNYKGHGDAYASERDMPRVSGRN